MKAEFTYFHCDDRLRAELALEIGEVEAVVAAVRWSESFQHGNEGAAREHQAAYNRAFGQEFRRSGWKANPILCDKPKLIGDFGKGAVFVEIQFGNSATLYRDYYKFQYGKAHGLFSLAVLIVPTSPKAFFPSRPRSVLNMAEYAFAHRYFTVVPINVPTMLVGLLPAN